MRRDSGSSSGVFSSTPSSSDNLNTEEEFIEIINDMLEDKTDPHPDKTAYAYARMFYRRLHGANRYADNSLENREAIHKKFFDRIKDLAREAGFTPPENMATLDGFEVKEPKEAAVEVRANAISSSQKVTTTKS